MNEPITVEAVGEFVLNAISVGRGMLSRGARLDPMGTNDLAAFEELLATYERELTALLARLPKEPQEPGEPPAPTR